MQEILNFWKSGNNKYFNCCSNICSFTSMITWISLACHSYVLLQNPMKCEVSNILHLVDMFFLSYLCSLQYSLLGRHTWIFKCQWILHTCVPIHNTNTNEVTVIWQLQIFYIMQPYLFFHIYDHLSILFWHYSLFLQMPLKFYMTFDIW